MYLCRVDRATGALTDIGPITPATETYCSGNGMAFGSDGKLYTWDQCVGLATLDTTTAVRTLVHPPYGGAFVGFPNGTFYRIVQDMGRDAAGVLWATVAGQGDNGPIHFTATVDTTTGDVTYAATLPTNIQTIDFQNEAGIPALGGSGLILLGVVVALVAVFLLAGRRLLAA